MITEIKDVIQVRHPGIIGMAFNPCIITIKKIEGVRDEDFSATITITDGEHSEIIQLYGYANAIYTDVREYVQSFFDTINFEDVDYNAPQKTGMGKELNFHIIVKYTGVVLEIEDEIDFRFSVFYVWGAMKIGGKEEYNSHRRVTYFRGYPFTIGLFSPTKNNELAITVDGQPPALQQLPSIGVWNIPITLGMDARNEIKAYFTAPTGYVVVFDNTFDFTFLYQKEAKAQLFTIDVRDGCENGYYLRWINRHGFYCYYLFEGGQEQCKTSADSLYIRNNLLAYDASYGYRGNNGRLQQMNREDSVPIFAPLVNAETWEMLLDLVTSPSVSLFQGWRDGVPRWMAVSVVAGTYSCSRAPLQDFVCNIVLPETSIQKL